MTIKSYRKTHGMTQLELALFLDVQQSTVHCWETGKFRPSLERRREIQEKTGGEVHAVRGWR